MKAQIGESQVDVSQVDATEDPGSQLHQEDDAVKLQISVAHSVVPFLTWVPPGHFYSAVPDLRQVQACLSPGLSTSRSLVGIDLREDQQLSLFQTFAPLARERSLAEFPGSYTRYGLSNESFGIGDAEMFVAMLRHMKPKRYLEVGSGFSTALALDVNELFLNHQMSISVVDPHPELIFDLVRPQDAIELLRCPVQSLSEDYFTSLEAGDILFIDSSHVVKHGSDVLFLVNHILPVIGDGVLVHLHDIYWPLEYPASWVSEGRAWNEAYFLHAFLMFNRQYEILLWTHWLATNHPKLVESELPEMLANPGGSIWLRKVSSDS